MPSINPINMFNTKAHNLIAGIVTDSPNKNQYLHEFFDMANKKYVTGEKEHNVQNLALLSYYTTRASIHKNSKIIDNETSSRMQNFANIVLEEIKKDKELEKKAGLFKKELNEMYPSSLRTRISIAKQGAVKSDSLVEKSFKKNLLIKTNILLDKIITKFEPIGNRIWEFIKPVE